ncbi:MAG: 4-hydroxythreonine-4-phosphate dehydrogenase PdxA [Spirochaetia bacterium]
MKPILAITPGDPAGIGPEVTAKALEAENIISSAHPIVYAPYSVMKKAFHLYTKGMNLKSVSQIPHSFEEKTVYCIEHPQLENTDYPEGKIDADCGTASFLSVERAVEDLSAGKAGALVTGTINKESLKAAKVQYIGHTEMLAGLTGTEDPLTMFQTGTLRIFFLSRHVSLRKACEMVTFDRVYTYIHRCFASLRMLGIKNPSLAVAGLNPHSGEHGLFGTEEVDAVNPAIAKAQKDGITVAGPIGADSVFHQAKEGRYSAVLSLYHDQGHIAAKTLDFHRTISVTLGLPFLRTSVDHGTAFDIAWSGQASSVSMEEALKAAITYTKAG